jgi:beta-glucosidase-like glycosyl hydrolase
LIINIFFGTILFAKSHGFLIPSQPEPTIENGFVDFSKLTLEQKIAQMIIVLGIESNSEQLKKMQIGGIHLHAMQSRSHFERVVKKYQDNMIIPLFVTVDLEGCISPFAAFKQFEPISNFTSIGHSFEMGKIEGRYLSELGVSINFAPVVDLEDQIWGCRSFNGDSETVAEMANSYLLGLQDEGVMGTVKHYPGKTLVIKDPHKFLAAAEITFEDLEPYKILSEKGSAKAVMISHLITYGKVNSEGKPSVASKKIVDGLKTYFNGLIISDEINMLGLKNFYETKDELYLEVFKAGSDIIINFNDDPNEIYYMIQVIKKGVENGEIDEERIDYSVKKILVAKGLSLK